MSVYKDKKTGKWFCVYRIRDIRGKQKQVRKSGFDTRELAYEYECNAVVTSKDYSKCKMKFGELYRSYYLYCKKKYKIASLEKYDCIYNKYLNIYEDIHIDKINFNMLNRLQDHLIKSELSCHRINLIFRILSDIFDFGIVQLDLNVSNPVGKIAKLKNRTNKSNIDFYTLDEFEKFISVIPDNEYIFKVIFMTLYYTGIRIGELQALDVKDIDLKNSYITINKNYVRQPNGRYIISDTKTESSSGRVRIPLTLKKELMVYLASKSRNEKLFIYKKDIIKRRTVENHKNIYCDLAGLRRIRIHDFRHSFASLIYEISGYNYSEVAKRLRHRDTSTVMKTYVHVFPDKQNEVDNKLDSI